MDPIWRDKYYNALELLPQYAECTSKLTYKPEIT